MAPAHAAQCTDRVGRRVPRVSNNSVHLQLLHLLSTDNTEALVFLRLNELKVCLLQKAADKRRERR